MIATKVRHTAFSCLLVFGIASPVYANDISYEMEVASAKYIGSVNLMQNISSSKCNYAIKKEFSRDEAIKEVAKELTRDENVQLVKYFGSAKFEKEMKVTWDELFVQPLNLMLEDGMDFRTACGILVGGYLNIYQQNKSEWEHTRNKYREAYSK